MKQVLGTNFRKGTFMKNRFHIIPHVHWDREWYFTQNKSTLYLIHDLTEIIETLENNNEIEYYLFDAQTSLIDDYLKYCPEMTERVRKLIREKRLLTGPWYTQTDQMIIHGESIVRNLMYGISEAEDYGYCFRVGYAVDCFGQGNQMPQIYEGMGIPYTVFKRGIQFSKIPATEFIWKSDEGSSVRAYHAIDYMNFRNPSEDGNKNIETVKKIEKEYAPRSRSGEMLLFNGFDQHPIRKDIVSIMKELQECNDFETDMKPLEKVLDSAFETEGLPEYVGELTSGQTTRVHKSIYSSRADLKIMNSKAENKLIRLAEPLQAIYYELTGRENRTVLKSLWKLMMENAAHDSIGCCNSDKVNRQIKGKFDTVQDTLNEYLDITKRKISNLVNDGIYSIQVYNFLPYRRTETVDLDILTPYEKFALKDTDGNEYPVEILSIKNITAAVKGAQKFMNGADGSYADHFGNDTVYRAHVQADLSVNAMGYETFRIVECDEVRQSPSLENRWLKVTLNENGSLRVYDKQKNHEYNELLVIEDGADAGDSYDWSSYPYDEIITSENCKAYDIVANRNQLTYKVRLNVPADLEERKNRIHSKELEISITTVLETDKKRISFRIDTNNTATDHRVRVLVKTDIPSEWSHADTTFGDISRPVYLPEEKIWKQERWDERPRTIEPMQSYVYLKDNDRCVGIVTDSVKEYEITGEEYDTIAYTLYRAFPYMGRSELPDRPGRASGQVEECPDANLYTDLHFTFALILPESDRHVADLANEYTTPFIWYQDGVYSYTGHQFLFGRSIYDGKVSLPSGYSSFELKGDDTKLSIYKLAEKGSDTIIRVYQSNEASFDVKTDREITECGLNEEGNSKFDNSRKYLKNKIVTLRKRGNENE